MAEVVGSDDPARAHDPAALISDPRWRRRSASTARSSSARGAGADGVGDRADEPGGVHQPGRDPPHRGHHGLRARDRGPSRFATARGSRSAGPTATLPLRMGAAAMLCGDAGRRARRRERQPGGPSAGRRRPAPGAPRLRLRPGRRPARALALATRRRGDRDRGRGVLRDGGREGPPRLPDDRADARRGRAACWPADGVTPARFGCLTPALALGTESLDRFERAGLSFSVD